MQRLPQARKKVESPEIIHPKYKYKYSATSNCTQNQSTVKQQQFTSIACFLLTMNQICFEKYVNARTSDDLQHVYRRASISALKDELRFKSMIQKNPNPTKKQLKKDLIYKNAAKHAQLDAFENLLTMFCISQGMDIDDPRPIPDEDRAIVYQAIRCQLPLEYLQLILEAYPNACESGGLTDHILHPIHAACIYNLEVLEFLLTLYPDSANQVNAKGQMPFELFLENKQLTAISSDEFVSVAELFTSLDPTKTRSKEIFSRRRESLKKHIILDCIVPSHVKRQATQRIIHSCETSLTDSDDETSWNSYLGNHFTSSELERI